MMKVGSNSDLILIALILLAILTLACNGSGSGTACSLECSKHDNDTEFQLCIESCLKNANENLR